MAIKYENGHFRFLSRYKDILKIGGENVDSAEIEAFLSKQPGINQVQIIGVPDPHLSEVACACVVHREGHEWSVGDPDEFSRSKLPTSRFPDTC